MSSLLSEQHDINPRSRPLSCPYLNSSTPPAYLRTPNHPLSLYHPIIFTMFSTHVGKCVSVYFFLLLSSKLHYSHPPQTYSLPPHPFLPSVLFLVTPLLRVYSPLANSFSFQHILVPFPQNFLIRLFFSLLSPVISSPLL